MDVTFGWGGHPVASRCSCSEVWLQERRSEQQAVRPSLFIREEMMLQPQPHIDLLISNGSFLGLEDVCEEGKKRLQPLPGTNSLRCPHSRCLFSCLLHVVLIQKYSVTEMWLILSAANIIQMPELTLIHREGNSVGKYSESVHLSCDCFPLTLLLRLYFCC